MRVYGLINMGNILPASGLFLRRGRCTIDAFLMISSAGTASSNVKARIRTKRSAFILGKHEISRARSPPGSHTHSTNENRYPIQARGPPMNVIWLLHTPGMALEACGGESQRSGLVRVLSYSRSARLFEWTYLNSSASSPHIGL